MRFSVVSVVAVTSLIHAAPISQQSALSRRGPPVGKAVDTAIEALEDTATVVDNYFPTTISDDIPLVPFDYTPPHPDENGMIPSSYTPTHDGTVAINRNSITGFSDIDDGDFLDPSGGRSIEISDDDFEAEMDRLVRDWAQVQKDVEQIMTGEKLEESFDGVELQNDPVERFKTVSMPTAGSLQMAETQLATKEGQSLLAKWRMLSVTKQRLILGAALGGLVTVATVPVIVEMDKLSGNQYDAIVQEQQQPHQEQSQQQGIA